MFKPVQSIHTKSFISVSIAFTLSVMASALMAETAKPVVAPAASAAAAAIPAAPAPASKAAATPPASATPATAAPADKTSSSSKEVTQSGSGSKKTCDDLKASIDEKIKAKGVKTFTLDIVDAAEVKDAKVVGSCEGGKKKITYKRG